MAFRKDCKKYPCDWCYSVKSCPEECSHFKHKDEVIVIRCKDCKEAKKPTSNLLSGKFVNCALYDPMPLMKCHDFCSYGERRTKNE